MWRIQSNHKKGETEFLADAIARVRREASLTSQADELLRSASHDEPLIAQSLATPQSPPYHSEGPMMHDHLRLILTVLYALTDEHLHLVNVEEFRAMKGYEGEVDEMEEMIKENVSLFEVFALCHDAAKWACVAFDAPAGSRGEALGFSLALSDHWSEGGRVERASQRTKYLELYDTFAQAHKREPEAEIFKLFYETYKIRCKFPGHARAIHAAAYRDLLRRVGTHRRLPDRDVAMLEDLIALHLEPITDFAHQIAPSRIGRYTRVAAARGYDADDFIDLLQACVFLDLTCGSMRLASESPFPKGGDRGVAVAQGRRHDFATTENFLRSEHDFAPFKRVAKSTALVERQQKEERVRLRAAELDGVALMELLKMEAGPAFGKTLAVVQAAILSRSRLPVFSSEINRELARRAQVFYKEGVCPVGQL